MILTKFYQIVKQFYYLNFENKIASQEIGNNQYLMYLFLYNVMTIVNPKYKVFNDSNLIDIPEEYYFFKNKYTGTDLIGTDALLRYSFYLIMKLIYADFPQIKINLMKKLRFY